MGWDFLIKVIPYVEAWVCGKIWPVKENRHCRLSGWALELLGSGRRWGWAVRGWHLKDFESHSNEIGLYDNDK